MSETDTLGEALLDAAERADREAVASLLRRGAPPDARDGYLKTPLMRAAGSRAEPADVVAVLNLLIEASAKLDLRDQAQTALMYAAHRDNLQAVELLIRAGADVLARAGGRGGDALEIALHHGNLAMARMLAQAERARGTSARPLLCAAILGDESGVLQALARGADGRERDGYQLSPLHGVALHGGSTATLDALLDAGADIDAADVEGVTPLYLAASMGHEALLRALIERGADLSLRHHAFYGDDALEAAIRHGHRGCFEVLLDARGSIDSAESNGTYLRAAASYARPEFVEHLLARGARVQGSYALVFGADDAAIVDMLLAAGADPNEHLEIESFSAAPLNNAIAAGAVDAVRRLLAAGADPNMHDRIDPPLRIILEAQVAEPTAIELAKLLLAAGADVGHVSKWRDTCLEVAERVQYFELAALLRRWAERSSP